MTTALALVLFGGLSAFVFIIFRYELAIPSHVAFLLTVPCIAVGAGIATTATYVLPINFLHSTMGLGVFMLLFGLAYPNAKR
jgi:hypothetical protein